MSPQVTLPTTRRIKVLIGLVGGLLAGLVVVSPAVSADTASHRFFSDVRISNVVQDPDRQAVEVGMRFSSSVGGRVTAIRFMKTADNRGVHTGSLWAANGTKLAGVTFVNERRTGWQTAVLPRSVAIQPGVEYVVSYHAPRGAYAAASGYFRAPVNKGVLTAPKSAGVYKYGASGFPTQTFNDANYWVDVVVQASSGTPVTSTVAPTTLAPTTAAPTTVAPTTSTSTAPAPTVTPSTTTTRVPTTTAAPTSTAAPPATGITYGWQLNASNTGLSGVGVDRNTLPLFQGSITPGMTISRVKISSEVDLANLTNVTLDRVWLQPRGSHRAITIGNGTTIKDSDIDGSLMVQGNRVGVYGYPTGNYTLSRNRITGMTVGLWLDGAASSRGLVTDTYVHEMTGINGAHMDGFTRRGGTGVLTIARSRLDTSGPSVTGAFFLQSTWGEAIANITVQDTYLEGGGYVMALEDRTSVAFNNIRVRSTGWGPLTTTPGAQITAWNNVRRYDGARLPLADGALISR